MTRFSYKECTLSSFNPAIFQPMCLHAPVCISTGVWTTVLENGSQTLLGPAVLFLRQLSNNEIFCQQNLLLDGCPKNRSAEPRRFPERWNFLRKFLKKRQRPYLTSSDDAQGSFDSFHYSPAQFTLFFPVAFFFIQIK